MREKEFNKQEKRIKKLVNKWLTPLGLRWWKIDIIYEDERKKDGETNYAPPSNKDGTIECIFDITCDYYYKFATIHAYLPSIVGIKDENLENYFLHECMHIILKPMQHKETAKEEELVATQLADMIGWIIEAVKKKKLK